MLAFFVIGRSAWLSRDATRHERLDGLDDEDLRAAGIDVSLVANRH